jgi:hypothetical protein
MPVLPNVVLRGAALLLAAAVLAGCGGPPIPPKADPHKAAVSLQAALAKWKDGATIDSLRQQSPAVYAVDDDWQSGQKLVNYEIRDAVDAGSNARIPVRLNIQSPNGLWWKEVEYRVQVEPVVSIVRQDE